MLLGFRISGFNIFGTIVEILLIYALALPSKCTTLAQCEDERTKLIVLISRGHFFPNSILIGIKYNKNSLFSLELLKEFGTQHVTLPPKDDFDFFAITATGDEVVTFVEILPTFSTFSTKTLFG